MKGIRIVQESHPKAGDIQSLSQALFEYNTAQVGYNDAQRVAIFLRDEEDQIRGGIAGHTFWGWLAIDFLWVHESLRGLGYGARLLESAEAEAIARGCRQALLDTLSFQAPDFYRKHGYQVYGVLEGFPGKHQRLYMRKRLVP